jgi:Domain of unknown function (DUF4283)
LILGDIVFPIEPFDLLKYDKGKDLVSVWVQVLGLPYHLWQDYEFHRIADELGGVLLDVDPRSPHHIDFTLLRIRVGVSDMDVLPSYRNMFFPNLKDKVKLYLLSFTPDKATLPPSTSLDPWNRQFIVT